MAQAQTKGDKHILVMSDAELEAVRNGAILNIKNAADSNGPTLNLTALKSSLDVLDAVEIVYAPVADARDAAKKGSKAAKA